MTSEGAPPASEPPRVTLELGDINRLDVSVSISAQASALALYLDAVGSVQRGVPEEWRRAIADAVGARGHDAARPLGHPAASLMPDFVHPVLPRRDVSLRTSIEVLRSTPPSQVPRDLATEFGEVPAHWRDPADRPSRWLTDYATALDAVGTVSEPLLRRARTLLDREIERVGVAVVRGGLAGLLAGLTPRLTYRDESLSFADATPGRYELAGRALVLVPMVAGPRLLMTHFDSPDTAWIGYPVPGVGRLWEGEPPGPASDPLELVVGPQRAAILRYLSRPATMAELAGAVGLAPNTLTFHAARLADAGLLVRERRGRSVRVTATDRGRQLLELLAR